MKYILKVNTRTSDLVSVNDRHKKFINGIIGLDNNWGLQPGIDYVAPEFKNSESLTTFPLGKMLKKKQKGDIIYVYRSSKLTDEGVDDDRVWLEFNPAKVDYQQLVYEALPLYISNFNAYLAQIYDDEFIDIDFDLSRGKNLREVIYRFYPVHYIDDQLCTRALGYNLYEMKERLEGNVEAILSIGRGLLIISTSLVMSLDDAIENHNKINFLLRR